MNIIVKMMRRYITRRANLAPICMNFRIITNKIGIIKILELIIGMISYALLVNFGFKYASFIGFSYDALLSALAGSITATGTLLLTYILSESSQALVKSSIFEILLNSFACINLLSVSFVGIFMTNSIIPSVGNYFMLFIAPFYPIYYLIIMFVSILSMIYAYDGYLAYKYFAINSI